MAVGNFGRVTISRLSLKVHHDIHVRRDPRMVMNNVASKRERCHGCCRGLRLRACERRQQEKKHTGNVPTHDTLPETFGRESYGIVPMDDDARNRASAASTLDGMPRWKESNVAFHIIGGISPIRHGSSRAIAWNLRARCRLEVPRGRWGTAVAQAASSTSEDEYWRWQARNAASTRHAAAAVSRFCHGSLLVLRSATRAGAVQSPHLSNRACAA